MHSTILLISVVVLCNKSHWFKPVLALLVVSAKWMESSLYHKVMALEGRESDEICKTASIETNAAFCFMQNAS